MTNVEQMNPVFKLGQPGDSKDFIIFILEQLHQELKKPSRNYKPSCTNIQLNQYDSVNTFNHFMDEFTKELSIISDLFFGIQQTRSECINCKNVFSSQGKPNPICYNYQIFNLIIFPLDKVRDMVRNMKMNNNQNNININNDIVTIYDCFLYNQKPDLFTGENRNYCNICNGLNDSYYTSLVYSFPTILILILNRGKDNVHKIKVDFQEVIDLTNFANANRVQEKLLYNLIGVITHIGESGPNAHFVASCKSSVNNNWYRFNDAFVYLINDVNKEIINFQNPYILFYQRKK